LVLISLQITYCYVKSREELPPRTKTITATKKSYDSQICHWGKLIVFGVLLREEKYNQDHFLAIIVRALAKENTETMRRVGRNEEEGHRNNSI
jgi:hypothetical protein